MFVTIIDSGYCGLITGFAKGIILKHQNYTTGTLKREVSITVIRKSNISDQEISSISKLLKYISKDAVTALLNYQYISGFFYYTFYKCFKTKY